MGGDRAQTVDISTLVEEHHREIYAYAYRLCGAAADAEDLTQTVFLTAHEKLDQLRSPEKARAWLFSILRNQFVKLCRKRRPVPAATVDLDFAEVASPVPEPTEFDVEQLEAALATLPETYRLVVVMFYFERSSYQQIADQLELPIGTVMSRLARAKARLRKALSPAECTPESATHAAGKHGELP